MIGNLFPPVPGGLPVSSFPYGVQYPDQLPAAEYGTALSAGLTSLMAAVANRDSQRIDIPVIGDSITEGQGASAFTSRWIAKANEAVRQAYPTAAVGSGGGLGFIPFQSTGETSFTWPVSLASGSVGDILDLGPVRQSTGFTTTTAVWHWTAPAGTTGVQIAYYDGSTPGGFTYQVAAGAVVPVANTAALRDALTAVIPITAGQVLTISATANGNCFITGLLHYAGDENSGITFHGCGHFGWVAGTRVPNGWNQPETFSLNWAQAYVNAFPNTCAIGIMLGINDADTTDANRTAAQFGSDLTGLISTIRGADSRLASIPLLLINEYQPGITVADPAGWGAYGTAERAVGAAVGHSWVTDLPYRMPANNGSAPYWSDPYHPTNLGHALIGAIVGAGLRIA